jgi:AraC-like DNA-binding protein
MSASPASSLESDVFERVASSPVFSRFEDAFRSATGLPLRFMRWDEEWCISEHRENQSPFCVLINSCESACEACRETNRKVTEEAMEVDGPVTCACFMGLCATAVPVKLGNLPLGFLKTGQVFKRQPTEEQFARIIENLKSDLEISEDDEVNLRNAYFETRQVEPKRYESMVTLLTMFAEQLSEHAETIWVATKESEPSGISKARNMIHQHLDEPLQLDEIAKTAGMSKSHFCRTFKDVTSMTVTEYTTRARIAWARKELLRPGCQVSEVAYKVGFQSLSQFNRSFAKIVGMSPTAFRSRQLEKAQLHPDMTS